MSSFLRFLVSARKASLVLGETLRLVLEWKVGIIMGWPAVEWVVTDVDLIGRPRKGCRGWIVN